ncbi:Type IV inositol polyphosphate 5-phosphatase 9 [Zea mays]|uniref:Type IV inositol polyphosphate 5-phosphatase 9 n=1 Tax=Zea mays TaxID=4577 RepID=A0A1D6KPH1_MAIZE|nr:Type IV inositol polyphosphate 5-phosphatase 9 [Zea mays]
MLGGQSETVKYRVFAGTWNVGGLAPPDDLDLEDWLDTKNDSYDIYVLGFQEIVPLNARNVLGPKQRRAAMKWQLLIGDALNSTRHGAAGMHGQGQGGAFRCLMSKQMVGIFVSVWTRSSLCRHVRHPGVCSVGAGVLGRLGNKVRSKQSRTRARHTRGRRSHRHADDGVSTCATRVVLLGDLNYRIAMDDDEARQLVRARKWGMLLEGDELLLELSSGRQFHGWHEGHVTFAPTYKYSRNSDHLHWCADGVAAGREKQHRAPAWCDRILWRGKGMKQVRYERCGCYRLSDHRPVRALFHAVCELADG